MDFDRLRLTNDGIFRDVNFVFSVDERPWYSGLKGVSSIPPSEGPATKSSILV